jgi:hypothetical protein
MIRLGIGERKVIHEGPNTRIVAVGRVGWKFNLVAERRRMNAMDEVSWIEATSITKEELQGSALYELVEAFCDRQDLFARLDKAHNELMAKLEEREPPPYPNAD